MSVLFFHTMKYRYDDPRNFNNDRFVLSKVRVSQSYWSGQETFLSDIWMCLNVVIVFSSTGSCCSSPVLHVGWSRLPEGEWTAQFVPCWLYPGEPPNPCKLSHIVPHIRNHLVEHTNSVTSVTLLCICVLCVFQKQQFVDLATGSLGQGLGVACGMAYTGKYFDKSR